MRNSIFSYFFVLLLPFSFIYCKGDSSHSTNTIENTNQETDHNNDNQDENDQVNNNSKISIVGDIIYNLNIHESREVKFISTSSGLYQVQVIPDHDEINDFDKNKPLNYLKKDTEETITLCGESLNSSECTYGVDKLGRFSIYDDEQGRVVTLPDKVVIILEDDDNYKIKKEIIFHVSSSYPNPQSSYIDVENIEDTQLTLKWQESFDDYYTYDLEYSLYSSRENNIENVEDTLKNGFLQMDWTRNYSYTVENLIENEKYYFQVLVRNRENAINCYSVQAARTGHGIYEPEIVSVSPDSSAKVNNLDSNIIINFNKEIDPATIDSSIIVVDINNNIVPGIISYYNKTVTIDPYYKFTYFGNYRVNVNTGIKDITGDNMLRPYTWSFETKGTNFQSFGASSGDHMISDSEGNIYIYGTFFGDTDFDPGPGESIVGFDRIGVYLSKFSPTGSYLWTKTIKCALSYPARSISIDNEDNIYITLYYEEGNDLDPGPGIVTYSRSGFNSAIVKLNSDGLFQWAKQFKGRFAKADRAGSIYIIGDLEETLDLDITDGVDKRTPIGTKDIFITKLNSSGDYLWSRQIGKSGEESVYYNGTQTSEHIDHKYWCYDTRSDNITFDNSGNVIIFGKFDKRVFYYPGDRVIDYWNYYDREFSVINKYDPDGNLLWSKEISNGDVSYYPEGSYYAFMGEPEIKSIKTDTNNNIYLTGYYYWKLDFDTSTNINFITSNGWDDIFLLKLNQNGDTVWIKTIGDSGRDSGMAISFDNQNNVYITGYFRGTVNFNTDGGSDIHISPNFNYDSGSGYSDVFLTKFYSNGTYGWTKNIGGQNGDSGISITSNLVDNIIYSSGEFYGTIDIDPEASGDELISQGSYDTFLWKYEVE